MTRTPAPKPGVYPNVPAQLYHHWDAVSASVIAGGGTMQEVRHAYLHPNPPTNAKLMGTAVHTAVLEPDRFRDEYVTDEAVVAELIEAGAKKPRSKTEYKEWEARAIEEGRLILESWQMQAIIDRADAIRQHPIAGAMLRASTDRELSLIWIDRRGVVCKARPDIVGPGFIADIKCASPKYVGEFDFPREIETHHYDLKAEHYLRGAAACGLGDMEFHWIAVSSVPLTKPKQTGAVRVACHQYHDQMTGEAGANLDERMGAWIRGLQTGEWPGLPETRNLPNLRPWYSPNKYIRPVITGEQS